MSSREGIAPVPEGEFLVPIERYMAAGVRLGTRMSNKYLEKRGFIFSVRHDGLRIFDLRKIDERIRIAAKMIARYDPPKVVVVSAWLDSSSGEDDHLLKEEINKLNPDYVLSKPFPNDWIIHLDKILDQ